MTVNNLAIDNFSLNSFSSSALLISAGLYIALPIKKNQSHISSWQIYAMNLLPLWNKFSLPIGIFISTICLYTIPMIYMCISAPTIIICAHRIKRNRNQHNYLLHCQDYAQTLEEGVNLLRSGQNLIPTLEILSSQSSHRKSNTVKQRISLRFSALAQYLSLGYSTQVICTTSEFHCITTREQRLWHSHLKLIQLGLLYGLPMVDIFESFVRHTRFELHYDRKISANISGARFSATLLTLLPIIGIVFGQMVGGINVLFLLLHTHLGMLLLFIGSIFLSIGMLWTDRIITKAITL